MKKYRKIYIEITNVCNLNCSFCPKTARQPCVMTVEKFRQAARMLKDRGQNFYLHVMGEPTAHPQFGAILDICREYGMTVNITTNGSLLDKTGDMMLKSSVRMVSVSLHSFEANSLDSDMQRYLDKVISFAAKAADTDTACELRLWNFDRKSLYDTNKLNGQILSYIQKNLELDFDLADAVEEQLEKMEGSNSRKFNLRLKGRVFLGMAEHFEWPDINSPVCNEDGFCYGLRNQIAVLANGDVVPCCLDSDGNMVLGNIFSDTLDDILNSRRARDIYTGFTNQKAVERLCQTCGYMQKFFKNRN